MISPTTLQGASTTLDQLAARQSRLESRLIALDRAKLQARRDLERATREHASRGQNPGRADPTPIARRRDAALQALESMERERHEIAGELPSIKRARQEVIARAAAPAWAELQRCRAKEYATGISLAAKVGALVAPYAQVAAEAALAKSELDALLATLGKEAQQIRAALIAQVPETALPDTPEERQAMRRAYEIRNVFSQELSHKW